MYTGECKCNLILRYQTFASRVLRRARVPETRKIADRFVERSVVSIKRGDVGYHRM